MSRADFGKRCVMLAVTAIAFVRAASASSNGYSIQQIGLNDSLHTPTSGSGGTMTQFVSDTGQALGYSQRFSGSTDKGIDAWMYSPATNTTSLIGISDGGHTQTGGYVSNAGLYLSAAGQVTGVSQRYSGATYEGTDAWFYSPSTNISQIIGQTDPAAVSVYLMDQPIGMNSVGQVIGQASGGTNHGLNAWLYSPSTHSSQIIGLTDAAHTNSFNQVQNNVIGINDAGQVIGVAPHFLPGAQGQDAWIYSSVIQTAQILPGLTDAAHTATSGVNVNYASVINATGLIAGTSRRYSGNTAISNDAWLYSPTTNSTQMIGLTDAAHTQAGIYFSNSPFRINAAGQVTGTTSRSSGNTLQGQDAWVYSPATASTQLIGLVDTAHTQASGLFNNTVSAENRSGLVAGNAERYNGATDEGSDAWIYDPGNHTTYDLFTSQSPAGSAQSSVQYLSDDGTAFGFYDNYAGGNTYTLDAFRWTEAGGLQDLGPLVQGGLTNNGWASLAYVGGENSSGQIVGSGILSNGLQRGYLLTPVAVPEPATGLLLAIPFLMRTRRRQRSVDLRLCKHLVHLFACRVVDDQPYLC